MQSRYYDANTCRFINADGYVSTGQGLLGYNMFAYCNNNPVNCVDYSGNIPGMVMVSLNGVGEAQNSQPSISHRLNINGDNPSGDIVVIINGDKVEIKESYMILNEKTQRLILENVFNHKDYAGLGMEIIDRTIVEWFGHNAMYWAIEESNSVEFVCNIWFVKELLGGNPQFSSQNLNFSNNRDRFQDVYEILYEFWR